jgi:hypothetical protein
VADDRESSWEQHLPLITRNAPDFAKKKVWILASSSVWRVN